MSFMFKESMRPTARVYLENAALAACIVLIIFNPVALLLIFILFAGLSDAVKHNNVKSFLQTARGVQVFALIIALLSGGGWYYHQQITVRSELVLADYKTSHPYREEIKFYNETSYSKYIGMYGTELTDKIIEIKQKYNDEIDELSKPIKLSTEASFIYLFVSTQALFYILVIQFGWLWPLVGKLQAGEVVTFVSKTKQHRSRKSRRFITGAESLSSYSVADELLKWTALRESGTVSEAEYKSARDRLLQH